MRTRLSAVCGSVLEAGWLFALILTPLFFNIFSARSFEPDKTFLLRSIALIMAVAWAVRWIENHPRGQSQGKGGPGNKSRLFPFRLQCLTTTPGAFLMLLFLTSYAFSTAVSIFPRISFFGSYSRLQGLYTFLCYGVIFFILLGGIKTKIQVERFFKAVVLTSIPVSVYGILQHYRLDPLAWATTIDERITGANMGNPIFVAAYLIMVVPVTMSMIMQSFAAPPRDSNKRWEAIFKASAYAVALALQLSCIIFTQSRGPWLGLLGAFFVLFLGMLIYAARKSPSDHSFTIKDVLKAFLFALGSLVTGFFPGYCYFLIKRKGFSWLWMGFVIQTLIVAGFLFTLNMPSTPFKEMLKIPYIGRLGELSHKAQSGTTRVRVLIWEGTADLIRSNPGRLLFGYGPESMKHVWDPFSPAELTQLESKRAAPDRAHNETFDRIVTTGIGGLIFYMLLVGAIFYYGFKWIGFISSRSHTIFFFIITMIGSTLGILLPRLTQGDFSFSGVGLSLGFVAGISFYLISSPFTTIRHEKMEWTHFLILGILGAITAHFIEIHFGIAIVSTRLYFFAYAAVLFVIGTREFSEHVPFKEGGAEPSQISEKVPIKGNIKAPGRNKPIKKTKPEKNVGLPSQGFFVRPVMVHALLTALIMSTLLFCLMTNTGAETDAFSIIWFSLVGSKAALGSLIVLIVTYLFGALLVLEAVWHDSREAGQRGDFLAALGLYTVTNLVVLVLFAFIHASYLKPGVDVGNVVSFFSLFVLGLGLTFSFFLTPSLKEMPSLPWKSKALWSYAILLLCVFVIISATNITPVKADIYLKLGLAHEKKYQWNQAIAMLNRAIEADPKEETYYLNLGRILFGKANSSNDLSEKNAVFEKIRLSMEQAHELNPMNSDHIANLGLVYLRWSQFDPNTESRREKLAISNSYFQKALEKSPRKTIIINNWARVFAAEGNFDEAVRQLNYSLSLDNTFAETYIALGDVYSMQGNTRGASHAYENAVRYDPLSADALSMLGLSYFKEGRLKESLELTRKAVELRPNLMKAQSLLGILYFRLNRYEEAIDANLKVLTMRQSDVVAHRNLVILYEKVGRRDRAIEHLEQAIHYTPPQDRQQLEQILQYMKSGKASRLPGS